MEVGWTCYSLITNLKLPKALFVITKLRQDTGFTRTTTINGQKMGKSLGNFITLDEFFAGTHKALEKAYSPMTIRFFILMAHYRSPLDFSNGALQAAEKGLSRLLKSIVTLSKLSAGSTSTSNITELEEKCYEAMNDDLNSPILIANLFEGVRIINSVNDQKESLTQVDLDKLKNLFNTFIFDMDSCLKVMSKPGMK